MRQVTRCSGTTAKRFAYTRVVTRVGEFGITLETVSEGTVVATVDGELDLATCPELEQAMAQASLEDRLVVDLEGCTFLDSSAIRVLVERARASREAGGSMAIVASGSGIRRVLEIAALESLIELHPTREAALS